jgi:hypothetical protein
MQLDTIPKIWPGIKTKIAHNQFGTIIVLTGKGCKAVANHLARENYLNGDTDTLWRDVRHGLGYAIPLYNNPLGFAAAFKQAHAPDGLGFAKVEWTD